MLCEKYKEQFLQPEIRCDTYIGIEMKQVWFAELQLLEKFIDVCNKHGLSYQLVGGSLLGAIRHKGKSLITKLNGGGYYAPLLQMKIKRFMICYRALIEEKMILQMM